MRKQLEIDAMQKVSLESVTIVTDTEEAVLVNSALAPKGLDSLITILEGVWHGEWGLLGLFVSSLRSFHRCRIALQIVS